MVVMHDTAFHVRIVDVGLTQIHSFVATDGFRSSIVLDKPEGPRCHRRFSSISGARHHVHRQSCQRSEACTARAAHLEVAQTKDLTLPPPPGLESPVIASSPTELASTPVKHVVLRFNFKQSRSARLRTLSRSGLQWRAPTSPT